MKKLLLALSLLAMAASASAANLYIIGDATPYGWSTDEATALLSTAETPQSTPALSTSRPTRISNS